MCSAWSLHFPHQSEQEQRKVSFLYNEAAAATTEYAIFLLLLIVSAMVGFVAVSGMTHFIFQRAYTAVMPSNAESANLVISQPLIDQKLRTLVQHGSRTATDLDFVVTILGGLLGLCFAVVLVMSFAKSPRRRAREQPKPQSMTAEQLREVHRRTLFAKRNLLRRVLGRFLDERRIIDLPVQYFMSEQVQTVTPDTPLERVCHIMRQKGIRHLVVTGNDGQPQGVISSHDPRCRTGSTARDVMTAELSTVDPEVPISQAITLLVQQGISSLPVVRDGKLAGILTTTDILIGFQALIQAWELVHQPAADSDELEATECEGDPALTVPDEENNSPHDPSSETCVC
ncbi:cyclic nucleotide-binding/CBS domain-containing protein [Thermogutta sp.]|uniref:CBS domain-containing protein n=1 Tax=Thermogutta sp. TaxID=1962930 RepID=UPI003C7A7C53